MILVMLQLWLVLFSCIPISHSILTKAEYAFSLSFPDLQHSFVFQCSYLDEMLDVLLSTAVINDSYLSLAIVLSHYDKHFLRLSVHLTFYHVALASVAVCCPLLLYRVSSFLSRDC